MLGPSVLLAGLALCQGFAAAAGWSAEQWPRWRGPTGDGNFPGPPLLHPWNAEQQPQSVWEAPLGPGYSGIAVSAGRVVTMDRDPENARERVVCLDAASGKLLWTHAYPADYDKLDYDKGPRATPTIAGQRVYSFGAVGHLCCLDLASGKPLWSRDLKREADAQQPLWGFASSPLLFENLVIVHPGLKPDGCYAAFDRETGKEAWRSGSDPAGYGTPILFSHEETPTLLGWTPLHVVALDPRTGRQLWQIPYKVTYGVSIATPVVHEGIALVCGYWEGSKAVRLGPRRDQAELLWEENRYLRGLMAQPLVRGGYAYLLDKTRGLVCFRLKDHQIEWTDENRLTPRGRNPQATLVWRGTSDQAIALNSTGELVLVRLTPAGYQELARQKIVGETWAHPAYAGPFVYARDDKQLVCWRLPVTQAGGKPNPAPRRAADDELSDSPKQSKN